MKSYAMCQFSEVTKSAEVVIARSYCDEAIYFRVATKGLLRRSLCSLLAMTGKRPLLHETDRLQSYHYVLFLSIIFLIFRCADVPDTKPVPTAIPPTLSVINISEFDIKELYVYAGAKGDFKSQENYVVTFFDDDLMNKGDSIDFEENKFVGDHYVTFVRDISSTSAGEVAVTMESALTIESGHYYLYLLEDDFTYKVVEE